MYAHFWKWLIYNGCVKCQYLHYTAFLDTQGKTHVLICKQQENIHISQISFTWKISLNSVASEFMSLSMPFLYSKEVDHFNDIQIGFQLCTI